ncbi:MAG: hypothetical protein WKF41_18275 [Gaiellaceae bacterium]
MLTLGTPALGLGVVLRDERPGGTGAVSPKDLGVDGSAERIEQRLLRDNLILGVVARPAAGPREHGKGQADVDAKILDRSLDGGPPLGELRAVEGTGLIDAKS